MTMLACSMLSVARARISAAVIGGRATPMTGTVSSPFFTIA
jgi:hypothetical protein